MKTTPKMERFVKEYLVDLCAMKAAIRAGYSPTSAKKMASDLMKRPGIRAAIAKAQEQLSERTAISQDMVLERWWQIATADPNELVQYRRNSCRHCHGAEHLYQWRDVVEFTEACTAARDKEKTEPDDGGGYGFNARELPHPACPRCNGEGYGRTHIHDTGKLTGPARLLYAGMKEGKDGIEIKLQDQAKALENVARHLGMFKERVEHSGFVVNIDGADAKL